MFITEVIEKQPVCVRVHTYYYEKLYPLSS